MSFWFILILILIDQLFKIYVWFILSNKYYYIWKDWFDGKSYHISLLDAIIHKEEKDINKIKNNDFKIQLIELNFCWILRIIIFYFIDFFFFLMDNTLSMIFFVGAVVDYSLYIKTRKNYATKNIWKYCLIIG